MADITVIVQSPGSEYWGQSTWSANDWGGSGLSITTSQGSVTTDGNADVGVTGIQLTSSIGTSVGGTSALVQVTGSLESMAVGSTVVGIGVPVTGISSTSSIGSTTVDESQLTGEGWGRRTWGNLAWGGAFSVIPTGQTITSSIGAATGSASFDAAVSGVQASFSLGSFSLKIDQDITVFASEDQLDFTFGTLAFEGHANVSVTGQSLTSSQGNTVGGLKTPVDVSGIQASFSIGNFTLSQTTTESPSGIQATMSIGAAVGVPGVEVGVTGLSITSALGEDSITANGLVVPTGIALTSSIGTVNVTAWQEIDPGVTNTWTEVDLAA